MHGLGYELQVYWQPQASLASCFRYRCWRGQTCERRRYWRIGADCPSAVGDGFEFRAYIVLFRAEQELVAA